MTAARNRLKRMRDELGSLIKDANRPWKYAVYPMPTDDQLIELGATDEQREWCANLRAMEASFPNRRTAARLTRRFGCRPVLVMNESHKVLE